MREIETHLVVERIKEASIKANYELGEDTISALSSALDEEESPLGREIIQRLLENARIAREELIPICQDTGLVVVFAEVGSGVKIKGGELKEAIEEGIRQGYQEGYLRKSVCHPLSRKNTGDNTPVIIHWDIVPGDSLKLWVVPKGGGSENMSKVFMLPPSAGIDGIKAKVLETVKEAGPNPCPPIIVGVGIGGNFETCAILAKKSLIRPLGSRNPDPMLAELEQEFLTLINKSGIGPEGFGGRITALGVHILMAPCHIASLPLAVNIQCHANRHVEIVL